VTLTLTPKPQPSFNKQFDLLIDNLNTNTQIKGYTNYIFCSSEQQANTLSRYFCMISNSGCNINLRRLFFRLYEGFVDHQISKHVCYTDHQVFERYHKFQLKNGYAKKQAITLKELTNLSGW